MKKTKEIEFNLQLDYFMDHYRIYEDTTEEEIINYIQDYLDGCDDEIYYNFKADEVYEEYKDEINKLKTRKRDLAKEFKELVNFYNLQSNKKYSSLMNAILKKLEEDKNE